MVCCRFSERFGPWTRQPSPESETNRSPWSAAAAPVLNAWYTENKQLHICFQRYPQHYLFLKKSSWRRSLSTFGLRPCQTILTTQEYVLSWNTCVHWKVQLATNVSTMRGTVPEEDEKDCSPLNLHLPRHA